MKLYKVKVADMDEDLDDVFEKNCPKIFNSKKKVEDGVLNISPSYIKLDLWGDVTVKYEKGEMSMEGSLGSSSPYDDSPLRLQKKTARPKTPQEMISTLKQWRNYQKKEWKEYADKF